MKNRRKKPGVKLTRAQKKKLEELTRQAKADGRHPNSAQKTIPYLSMYKDGLCRVTENYYTMSLLFGDMNYDLEDEAEQLGIFGGWGSFYSYFDCAVHVQMTGINSENDPEAFARALAVLEREFNSIVNALRKDERYGLLLSSRKTLAACCHAMPDCAFDGSSAQEYGFRADTKAYSYMIRCNPTQGNYNFYIYAYDRAKLDKVLEMQKEQMQKCEVPVYLYPRTYAQKHGEMEEYRMSRQANIACRDAIDRAIREHHHDNVLSRKAVQNVVGQYGFDRTLYVLAVTVVDKNWDGRISQNNKNWAKMQPVYADVDELGQEKNQAFVARSHPGLVDLFLRETRRAKEANLEKNTPALAKCKREKER